MLKKLSKTIGDGEIRLRLQPKSSGGVSLVEDLESLKTSIAQNPNNRILMRIDGFQDAFREINPDHLIIVVTIPTGPYYEDAVGSATTCDFKDGIIEFS